MKPASSSVTRAQILGALATCGTAGAVSWATPDGNLVVTLTPAVVVGAAVWGVVTWWCRRAVRPDDPVSPP